MASVHCSFPFIIFWTFKSRYLQSAEKIFAEQLFFSTICGSASSGQILLSMKYFLRRRGQRVVLRRLSLRCFYRPDTAIRVSLHLTILYLFLANMCAEKRVYARKFRMLFKKAPLMSGSRSAFAVATAYRVNNSEASFEGIPALK